MSDTYPVSRRNKVVRRHERGRYDKDGVHAILDGALVAHIAYVMEGQPFCTPTAFWRRQVIGETEPCPRQHAAAAIPAGMAPYQPGRSLDAVLMDAARDAQGA